jgi:hypothetical protein
MTEMLSQANSSHERWDRGWQVVQVAPSGQVLVHKHGATRTFWPGEFITQDGPGVPPRPGATVTVYSPHESRTTQPGFYFAFGQTVGDPQDIYDNVRFYWSIDAGAAADLVHGTTRLLNRFQIPFRFKCCNHRTLFYRLDSAVLYVSKRHYRLTAEVLVDLYRELRPHLRSGPLLFTRSLAPGLAFAEDPGTGESFGQFCCRVVAEGIWNAYLSGAQSVQARLDAIQKQFESYNLDFSRAYLRAGAVDQYEFPSYD